VVINLVSKGIIQVYFENEANARSFIDAAASVARIKGITLENKEKLGFAVSDLTPAQMQALNRSHIDSALVSMIAYGGPAEKAGLRFLDLITDVDGVKIRNADHLASILDSAVPGSSLSLTCLERTEPAEGPVQNRIWKSKTVVWKLDPRQ
jgi:S1-C subfamily serine protease